MATSGGVQAGGGGSVFPTFSGSGTPEGAQTATVGQSYVDTTNGALYFKVSGSGNTGWLAVGGAVVGNHTFGVGTEIGVTSTTDIVGPSGVGGSVFITDVVGATGSGNGFNYLTGAADGDQHITIFLGPGGAFATKFNADGTTQLPGAVATKPNGSSGETGTFGQVVIGTPRQNAAVYDILVVGSVLVTAATAGVVNMGVSPSPTPTVDPITPALTVAAPVLVPFSAIVPAGYYLSLTTSGTITIGTPVSAVTAL